MLANLCCCVIRCMPAVKVWLWSGTADHIRGQIVLKASMPLVGQARVGSAPGTVAEDMAAWPQNSSGLFATSG